MPCVDTFAPWGRTLDGGTARSLGIKVPRGDSSGEGGAAHGPLHPAVLSSKFLAFVRFRCLGTGSLVCFLFRSVPWGSLSAALALQVSAPVCFNMVSSFLVIPSCFLLGPLFGVFVSSGLF